jgi:3-oxoacyl-[acyl-carrier-protein] synthase II
VSDVAIVAFGAVSALGEGVAAASAGEVGAPARVAIARDEELERAGLLRPFAARVALDPGDAGDRATAILARALRACTGRLDVLRPGWRRERVGLILGTSSGGMRCAERAFAALAAGAPTFDTEAPTYFGPMARAARETGLAFDPAMLVLGACASSAIAVGLAARCLERGACDVALAGGFDDVSVFVAAGFEALRATTATPPPRPFRLGRDGMALGEGAAVLALARGGAGAGAGAMAYVAGFGAASDAVHLTAPDREGAGLARAASAALDEAGRPRVDLVSAHGTATPFNDAAESRAIARVLGGRAAEVPVHPFKAQVGHTLGAAGALETLVCVDALTRGVLPAAVGEGACDPESPARLLDHAEQASPRTALKLASAFGGANAALVVAATPPPTSRPRRAAFVSRAVRVACEPTVEEVVASARLPPERVARTDGLVRLALVAVARLRDAGVALDGAGLVVGSALATTETNALFAARIRDRGARAAEPRRFPYTSPNAVAGECAIAFALTGPGFSVGGGMHAALEALAAAALLVEAGDADRVVVVAADDVGPATRALAGDSLRGGAVALRVAASPEGAIARVGAISLRRAPSAASGVLAATHRCGHAALVPLVDTPGPCELLCASPPDVVATVRLDPL